MLKCQPNLCNCPCDMTECSYVMEERVLQNQHNFCDYLCANDIKCTAPHNKTLPKKISHNSHCTFKLVNSMQIRH